MAEAGVEGRRQRLTASNQGPPSPAAIPSVLLVVGLVLYDPLHGLLNVTNFDQDVFGLEICVDNATFAMQVVETEKDLLCDLFDERHRNTPMIPPLDQAQEVLPQDLENHAHVGAVGALVFERVEKADDMSATRVIGIRLDNLIEELDFVDGGFGVMGGGAYHLEGYVFSGGVVS